MKLNQIITSLLETDMYKFSMGEAIYHQFSDYKTTWTFKCRNTDVHFTAEMVQEIKEQIKAYCSLRFTEEELEYLNRITWIKGSYIDFLRLWQPRYEDFKISDEAECGLSIETFGTWLNSPCMRSRHWRLSTKCISVWRTIMTGFMPVSGNVWNGRSKMPAADTRSVRSVNSDCAAVFPQRHRSLLSAS